jgi:C1A family cysteine protease
MMQIIFCFIFSTSLFSTEIKPQSGSYEYQNIPEYKAILSLLKSYGEFALKNKEEKPQLSRGQQKIEEIKAKNKQILAQKTLHEKKSREETPFLSEQDQLKIQVKNAYKEWQKEIKEQRQIWAKEQALFLGKIKIYQSNTFEIPVDKEVIKEVPLPDNLPAVLIINQAFSSEIKDQLDRPTCAAFAGIKALEILLAQNNSITDLSEQYFYWASKPLCQTSPCLEIGSWVKPALKFSMIQLKQDIPSEKYCPYQKRLEGNETQVPLTHDCKRGQVQIKKFSEIKTMSEVIEKLKENTPVIIATKLSENFYKNNGLVFLGELQTGSVSKDHHAKGHALLAIGMMELPIKLKEKEGSYCLVVANSWGKGWGAGGYACLSEKWLLHYRLPSSFISVDNIKFSR